MKTIGLLGGASWPSTMDYYRILNQLTNEKFGGFHSAKILLHSIDYHEIRSRYYDGRWLEVLPLLKEQIEILAALRPDCIVICNNTLHKALDVFESELKLNIPIFHSIKLTAQFSVKQRYSRLLLLGTKFTMDDGFYQRGLESFGLQVVVPVPADRQDIQNIQVQIASGVVNEEFRSYFKNLIAKYSDVDAAVLACTELPLAISPTDFTLPIISPSMLQCQAAFDFAISSDANV